MMRFALLLGPVAIAIAACTPAPKPTDGTTSTTAEMVSSSPAPAMAATGAPAPAATARTTYGRASAAELAKLTPEQREVTQHEGTEPPYRNAYWDNHADGLYVDVVTGEPLFSSRDKFESGTGWPSFTRPVEKAHVTEKTDSSLGMARTEVKSAGAQSHLGHVFDDGPAPTGLRYCINSAALRFIPRDQLDAAGYGAYRDAVAPAKH